MKFRFTECKNLKQKPEAVNSFGKLFTDYMYVCEYSGGKWNEGEIKPFNALEMLPCASVLHYGQAAFEGLKAYRDKCGTVRLFRARDNFKRMTTSAERLCIPPVDEGQAYNALVELVNIEREWTPTESGTSLYIRPLVFAADESLGVHAAKNYKFIIILSPSGAYYANGFAPVALKVEREYVRAGKGGTGAYKVIGNYAASIKAGELAKEAGYDQVLWLDGNERKYVEEVGSMNIFFVIDGKLVTPELDGCILPGITRDSVIKIARHKGISVEERPITIDEVLSGAKSGKLTEIFGTGTAAVISPVDRLGDNSQDIIIGGKGKVGEISKLLYDTLTDIQTGRKEDIFGWVTTVEAQ
ncbi:MAG: branched-chain amino acid aminotransferase [Clostridiales bacterium]|nr:branched-chain amino acid aminotransferase [Clostridiales bacterium]